MTDCSPQNHVFLPPHRRCVWCQTTVHDDCMDKLADQRCDLGEFHHLIIPPNYLHRVNKLRRRHPDEYSKVWAVPLVVWVWPLLVWVWPLPV